MRKKIFLIALLLFFSALVFAQSLQTDKNSYEKGETITVSGFGHEKEKLEITRGNILLFEKQVVKDSFSFEYETSFLDPSGEWKVKIGEEEKFILVNSPPKGLFYLINFFSPSAGEHQREKEIKINVEITDAGKPLLLAKVFAFGAMGEKIELTHLGKGKYFADYLIPFDAPVGEWELIVTAKTGSFSSVVGGENKISLIVRESPIVIEVLSPSAAIVGLGEKTPITVKAAYASGLEANESTQITAVINGQKVKLQRNQKGEYFAEFTPKEAGELSIEFEAVDAAQNSGKKKATVIVGSFFGFFVQNLWAPALLLVLIIASIFYLTAKKFEKKMKQKSIKKELDETMVKIRSLDESYFKKRVVTRQSYKTASTQLRVKKAGLEEKIRHLESEKRNKNNKNAI